jgi:hypothetical protein
MKNESIIVVTFSMLKRLLKNGKIYLFYRLLKILFTENEMKQCKAHGKRATWSHLINNITSVFNV